MPGIGALLGVLEPEDVGRGVYLRCYGGGCTYYGGGCTERRLDESGASLLRVQGPPLS